MDHQSACGTDRSHSARIPAVDLAAVTILALIVRFVWHLVIPARDWPDSIAYIEISRSLLTKWEISSSSAMPLYPLAISLLGPTGVIFFQIVISALSVTLIYLISHEVFVSRSAAISSGLIASLYPPFVFYANMRLTETIYIFMLLLVFLSFYRGRFLIGSVYLVASILTRPSLDLLAPILIIAFCVARRETDLCTIIRRLALYAAVYILLMAPWWWHNWQLYHAFVRLNLGTGNLLIIENSNLFDRVGLDFKALAPAWERFNGIADPIARDKAMVDAAMEYIKEYPAHWLWRCVERFMRFWNPFPGSASRLANIVSIGTIVFVLALSFLTLSRLSKGRFISILPMLLVIAYLTAIHTVTHGIPRYRLPLEPLLIIIAGSGLSRLMSPDRSNEIQRSRWRQTKGSTQV